MENKLQQILSSYNFTTKSVDKISIDKDVFKITDDEEKSYFLKIFNRLEGNDILPGVNVYHTYEQIYLESEILHLLSSSTLNTVIPIKNNKGKWVTITHSDMNDEASIYSTITSFVDAVSIEQSDASMIEMSFLAGVAAAQLHVESEKKLLNIAVHRPHKRQEYIDEMIDRLSRGVELGTLSYTQFEILKECSKYIKLCMNKLDDNPENNIGLVHTDIRAANCMFVPNKVIPIDFSRSVFSYYLYDLGEMCAHMGRSDSTVENAILRGYSSIKPLKKEEAIMIQAFYIMFLMMVICEDIEVSPNSRRNGILNRFANEFLPCSMSGEGLFNPFVFEGI